MIYDIVSRKTASNNGTLAAMRAAAGGARKGWGRVPVWVLAWITRTGPSWAPTAPAVPVYRYARVWGARPPWTGPSGTSYQSCEPRAREPPKRAFTSRERCRAPMRRARSLRRRGELGRYGKLRDARVWAQALGGRLATKRSACMTHGVGRVSRLSLVCQANRS